MPQSVGVMGYRLQGSTKDAAEQLIQEAHAVQEAGAVALVLEAIPSDLAGLISEQLDIPLLVLEQEKTQMVKYWFITIC